MPRLTRWFLRSAIAYLTMGLALGVVNAAIPLGGTHPRAGAVPPAPALAGGRLDHPTRIWRSLLDVPPLLQRAGLRSRQAGLVAFAMLNVGLALRVVGEPAHAFDPRPTSAAGLALSALLPWLGGLAELAAVALFVVHAWRRLRV